MSWYLIMRTFQSFSVFFVWIYNLAQLSTQWAPGSFLSVKLTTQFHLILGLRTRRAVPAWRGGIFVRFLQNFLFNLNPLTSLSSFFFRLSHSAWAHKYLIYQFLCSLVSFFCLLISIFVASFVFPIPFYFFN